MSPSVFLAVLMAAVMHAGWNAFVKLRIEPILAMTLVSVGAGLLAFPAAFWTGTPKAAAWPWLLGSIVLHLGYYISLAEAYRRADMSQIYPIARGSAPLVTVLASALFLGQVLRPVQILAVMGLGCGVIMISLLGRRENDRFDPKAIGYALLTAVIICGYTLCDGYGAREAGDANAYSATLFVIDGLPLPLFVLFRWGKAGLRTMRPYILHGFGGGALALGSYWIAIWAMTVAPIPLVAALRESSVLFGAAIAVLVLKEPLRWPRLVAATVIVTSLILVRIG